MVPNHLLVDRGELTGQNADLRRVHREITARVHQSPDVQVTGRVEALLIIERRNAWTADIEGCTRSEVDTG